jgi:hypothetical protein
LIDEEKKKRYIDADEPLPPKPEKSIRSLNTTNIPVSQCSMPVDNEKSPKFAIAFGPQ